MDTGRLKARRVEMGYTQEELAKIIDVTPAALGMYEQGRREPDHNKLVMIANALDTNVDYLLGRSDEVNKIEAKEYKIIVQGDKIIHATEKEVTILSAVRDFGLSEDDVLDLLKDLSKYIKKDHTTD